MNAILSAARPHSFLGHQRPGRARRSSAPAGTATATSCCAAAAAGPNFDTVSIALAEQALAKAKLPRNIVVDCSHANSWKKPELQPLVLRDVVHQIREGNRSVVGLMVESFIEAGNQPIPADLSQLRYGCSVTDACVGWDTTAEMLRAPHALLRDVLPRRGAP